MGLCPGLQGGIRTTLTHTVLLLSLLLYPSHDPSLPLFFLPSCLFPPTVHFSAHVSSSSLVAVISGGTVIKQSEGISLYDPGS